jgi:hypothetical protein
MPPLPIRAAQLNSLASDEAELVILLRNVVEQRDHIPCPLPFLKHLSTLFNVTVELRVARRIIRRCTPYVHSTIDVSPIHADTVAVHGILGLGARVSVPAQAHV